MVGKRTTPGKATMHSTTGSGRRVQERDGTMVAGRTTNGRSKPDGWTLGNTSRRSSWRRNTTRKEK
eukprot:16433957-Heterocapsa_arctica.AAC.1